MTEIDTALPVFTDNGTPPLTVGQHIMATPPLGHRRVCRVDRVSSDGLIVLSFPRPRGKGRCAWATDVRWLTPATASVDGHLDTKAAL